MADKTILIVGTYDTKDDELAYMASRIAAMNGDVDIIDRVDPKTVHLLARNPNLSILEVDVHDSQPQTFTDTHSGSVK